MSQERQLEQRVEGVPQMPNVEEPGFKDWLKQSIINTYKTIIQTPKDEILSENYLAQMNLYDQLYGVCCTQYD